MSEQYFSVHHCLTISVIPMEQGFELPDHDTFEAEIPEPFKISNTIVQLDLSNARALRSISDDIGYLVDVINQQSRKLNLLMTHILMQDDDPQYRHLTLSFGGSNPCSAIGARLAGLCTIPSVVIKGAAACTCGNCITVC